MNIKLVHPGQEHEKGYHEMIEEFIDNKEKITSGRIKLKENENYKNFLVRVKPSKDIAGSLYFILNEKEKLIGSLSIRHYLTEAQQTHGGHIGYEIKPSERRKGYASDALKLALLEAKKIGIDKVILTCDKSNIASSKTIEKNGGILDSEYLHEGIMIQKRLINII